MKKLIITASLMLASLAAFGQGQLVFANATSTRITNNVTGVSAAAGTVVGLYIGTVGEPAGSLDLITSTNCFIPGTYNGGVRTLVGWGAGAVTLQVRAWLASTVYPSYEAAYAAGLGGDGSVLLGVSGLFTHTLTSGTDTPQSIAGNAGYIADPGRLRPVIVPEPSSVALGLLGLGAVALFRRRK